jgi:stage III sporulation protein AF
MISALIGWTKQLLHFIVLILLVQLILPENKFKGYLQLVLGLMVISVVLEPVISLVKQPMDIQSYEITPSVAQSGYSTDYWIEWGVNMNENSQQKVLNETALVYADQITVLLRQRFEEMNPGVISLKLSFEGMEELILRIEDERTLEKEAQIKDLLFGVLGISPSAVEVTWEETVRGEK